MGTMAVVGARESGFRLGGRSDRGADGWNGGEVGGGCSPFENLRTNGGQVGTDGGVAHSGIKRRGWLAPEAT